MSGNRDWLRDTLIIVFVAYLLNIIYTSIVKLQERQIGSTEVAKDAPTLLMPSVTFCPAAMKDYPDKEATNITEDSANLPTPLEWVECFLTGCGVEQNVLIDNRLVNVSVCCRMSNEPTWRASLHLRCAPAPPSAKSARRVSRCYPCSLGSTPH